MTQEDKELLLKDLSARLPYGIKFGCDIKGVWTLRGITHNSANYICWPNAVALEYVKPYLRPMSSMTEEEVKEFYDVECMDAKVGYIKPTWNWHFTINGIDWLNRNHFDYHGLIEKGLALEVTKENNPYK